MKKYISTLVVVLTILALALTACGGAANPALATPASGAGSSVTEAPPSSSQPVEVRWYVGLGTGGDPEQQATQNEVVDEFNATHPNIKLILEVVTYDAAFDTLATEVASGNPPDVVGPVGVSGAESFHGAWLDLAPLVEKTGYDLTQFDKTEVDFWNIAGEGQVGLPFASYPSVLYYQPSMFEEAGLNLPPHKYGEMYQWPDGTEAEWNFDTLTKVALKLTVDKNGKDATQEGFDPTNIVQYGYVPQYQDARAMGSYWGADRLVEADGTTARIPPQWADAWKWLYDGMWNQHFIPTDDVIKSEQFGADNPFNSGKIAMALTHTWYTCCVESAGEWDMAVVPTNNGKVTANFNADTFRIMKGSKHPDEAFEVLTYLIGEASLKLLAIYGGMPARTADQESFFTTMDEQFPWKPDWQVAKDGIQYADIPNFEAYMPNYQEAQNRMNTFTNLIITTPGLSMDDEIAKFKSDLQAIYDKKSE